MPANLSGPTLIVILFIVLLLFGAPKLPALARSIGQSMKILKKEVSTPSEETDAKENPQAEPPAVAVTEAPVTPEPASDVETELAKAKAEAEALRAEAEALRAQADEASRKAD